MKRIISVITSLAVALSMAVSISADTTIITNDRILVEAKNKRPNNFDKQYTMLSYTSAVWKSARTETCSNCGVSYTISECVCGECDISFYGGCKCGGNQYHKKWTGKYVCVRCSTVLSSYELSSHIHYYDADYGYNGTESTFYEQIEVE